MTVHHGVTAISNRQFSKVINILGKFTAASRVATRTNGEENVNAKGKKPLQKL